MGWSASVTTPFASKFGSNHPICDRNALRPPRIRTFTQDHPIYELLLGGPPHIRLSPSILGATEYNQNLYVPLVSFTWGNIRICGGKAGLRSDLWGYALCTPSHPNISPPYPNRSELFYHTPTDLNVILLYPNRSELAPYIYMWHMSETEHGGTYQ